MKDISIAIADDHRLFREGINMIVSGMQGITLSIQASGGNDLLTQLESTSPLPDVILLDIEMEDMNGIEVLKTIRERMSSVKVIILTMHTEPVMVSKLMKLGAAAYLKKDVGKKELEIALRTVCENGAYVNEYASNALLLELRNEGTKTSHSVGLTAREKEVLTLICQEYTTQEIGEKLFISERTVEGHRKNLCSKLEAKNTAGLVRRAIQLNLIDLT